MTVDDLKFEIKEISHAGWIIWYHELIEAVGGLFESCETMEEFGNLMKDYFKLKKGDGGGIDG